MTEPHLTPSAPVPWKIEDGGLRAFPNGCYRHAPCAAIRLEHDLSLRRHTMSLWRRDLLEGASEPAYLAICEHLARFMGRGDLQPGDRLPSHRALARRLGLSLGTVTRAYAEARRRGLVEGEPGRGTYVTQPPPQPGMRYPYPRRTALDLYKNHPVKLHDIEGPAWRRALADLAARQDLVPLMDNAWSVPTWEFQRHGSRWFRRLGFEAPPERIVDCPGLQGAVASILATVAKPGDLLVTAELTFPVVTAIAQRHGLEVRGLAMDREGLIPEAFEEACRRLSPRFLYVEPNLHSPTNALMSAGRRRRLAALAEAHGVWVLEMDSSGPMLESRPRPLTSHLPHRSFLIGEVWHALSVGLRCAFVASPAPIVERLTAAASSMAGLTPPLTAAVVGHWLEHGVLDQLVERRRAETERRQKLVRRLFAERVRTHPRAHHAWLRLPETWTSADFVAEAARRDVAITDGGWFATDRPPPRAVRLCLGNVDSLETLELALRRLLRILKKTVRP